MAFIFMTRVSREKIWESGRLPTSLGTPRKAECATGQGMGGADDVVMVATRPPGDAPRQSHGARPHPRGGARFLRRGGVSRGPYPALPPHPPPPTPPPP